jgi:hypothetical protein
LDPQSWQNESTFGILLFRAGDAGSALASLNAALALVPPDTERPAIEFFAKEARRQVQIAADLKRAADALAQGDLAVAEDMSYRAWSANHSLVFAGLSAVQLASTRKDWGRVCEVLTTLAASSDSKAASQGKSQLVRLRQARGEICAGEKVK